MGSHSGFYESHLCCGPVPIPIYRGDRQNERTGKPGSFEREREAAVPMDRTRLPREERRIECIAHRRDLALGTAGVSTVGDNAGGSVRAAVART